MDRVPDQREPRRARGGRFGVYAGIGLLVAVVVATQSVRAEPIALGAGDAEPRLPGTEAPLPAGPNALPGGPTDESVRLLSVPNEAVSAVADPGDAPPPTADSKTAPHAGARAPWLQHAEPGRPMSEVAHVVGVGAPGSALTVTGDEMAADEPDWERGIKEAIRPIYDDLTASGVVDAVQGFRSYLAMLGVLLSPERTLPAGDRAPPGSVAEPRVGPPDAGWELQTGRTDALMLGKSEAQVEKEKLIATMIVNEWFAAILPWIYGALALIVAWQIAKLIFAYVRSRSRRAHRRTAKRRHRSADSARARARS